MLHPKTANGARKIVWRMNSATPQGGVSDGVTERREAVTDDTREHGWLASSLELLGGVRVTETPMDTLPGELIDAFLKR
jgi:hypothetical protein